jgi:hypothetical protein
MGEGDIEPRHVVDAAEHGLAVGGNRLGADPLLRGLELRVALQDPGCLSE